MIKYHYLKNSLLFLLFLLTIGCIFYSVIAVSRWPDEMIKNQIIDMVWISVLWFLDVFILVLSVCYARTYALLRDDGIHIIFRKQSELAFISWEMIQDIQWEKPYSIRERPLLLILHWEASFRGKPIASYGEIPRSKYQEVQRFLLDNLMVKLEKGKISTEDFYNVPFLVLVLENKERLQCHEMWRNRKFNGVTEPGESSRGA